MVGYFSVDSLKDAELTDVFRFADGARLMRLHEPGPIAGAAEEQDTMLFDLKNDPEQKQPVQDEQTERRMIELLERRMYESEAPEEQFRRLGLRSSEHES
jgi:hypothetical protein